MSTRLVRLGCAVLLVFFSVQRIAVAQEADLPAKINYSRDIKPILAGSCFKCHGPDAGQRQAELRLDEHDAALQPAESGMPAILPGKPDESELIRRVTSTDASERMPPEDSKKPPLKARDVELLKRWIAQGANFEPHWSYGKLVRPRTPDAGKGWAANPIDAFLAAAYGEHQLQPSPSADRRTLVRRLSFDLLGLPPSAEEIDAFVADQSPAAYEQLVDRLLASPHYGERMALQWLDLVRFADTGGYHSDNHRDIWLYRDWVIQAFNENKPYDQFTIEQLAGDLLDGATRDQRIASGYNRLLMTTEEGGAQPREYMAKYSADRVRNVSVVWLGSTLGCSECHDHKFDPFTTKDFYSMAAFFADVKEIPVGRQEQTPLPVEEQAARLKQLEARIAETQAQINQPRPELESAQAEWEQSLKAAREVNWQVLKPASAQSGGGATLTVQDDGTILASGANPSKDVFTLEFNAPIKDITALRLEVLPHDSLPKKGPGRSKNGNFVLNELDLQHAGQSRAFSTVTATHGQGKFQAADAGDGKPDTGWAILPQVGKANEAVFELVQNLGDGAETSFTVKMHQNYGTEHALGHFRISVTSAARPVRAAGVTGIPENVASALAVEPGQRSAEQKQTLSAYYRTIAPALQPLQEQLAALEQQKAEILKAAPTSLVSMSVPARDIHILPRGNWLDDNGAIVQPAVPASLGKLEIDRRATRLDLARWFASRDNPLVARVYVNRLWKLMFGQGLVKTPEDFGSQGAWPSHPELLDWLAVEFIESGWNIKYLMKLMAMSSAYRQSSAATRQQREQDPLNLYLARQNAFRLDAEFVRDNALKVSGLWSPKIGGPSVKPYQPEGYWAWLNFPVREYVPDQGDEQYRRGLYTYWQRTFHHPSLAAFDAPSREECTADRPRSNTPLQALVLLNDPTYVEAATALAERTLREGGSDSTSRANFAMRRACGRAATDKELAILAGLVERRLQEYRAEPAKADALTQVGFHKPAAGVDRVELAAWTAATRAILNMHETITRN
jgi:hypothetical protein